MPNSTKDEPAEWRPDAKLMNKSWVELAEEEDAEFYGTIKTQEEEPQRESSSELASKSVFIEEPVESVESLVQDKPEDLGVQNVEPTVGDEAVQIQPEVEDSKKALKRIDFGESPVKDESPMKVESPLRTIDDESPMKVESPAKTANSPARKELATRRLWVSPRRQDARNILNLRMSPRRPAGNHELMSPPRDQLKRKRDMFSPASSVGSSPVSERFQSPKQKRHPEEIETDPEVLRRRQKQIDYGKNTEGYRCYVAAIPKHKRLKRHPRTPPRDEKHSRRAWDGMVRSWRQQLHNWDPPGCESLESLDCLDVTDSMSESSAPSDATSEVSYPGSGGKVRPPYRPSSTLSLEDFPPLV